MKFINPIGLLTVVILLSACAGPAQQRLELAPSVFSSKDMHVGVAMTKMPNVDTSFPGAFCLLCMATASIANAELTKHTQTLPIEDLPMLKNQIADALRKRGVNASVIAEDIDVDALPNATSAGENLARKNFAPLLNKYQLEKIVVINITTLGMERPYSAYIPNGDPKAVMRGTGYMVNLRTNAYEWYLPVNVLKSSDGKWDEPPKFPGLTNAYFQALEIEKGHFLAPFK